MAPLLEREGESADLFKWPRRSIRWSLINPKQRNCKIYRPHQSMNLVILEEFLCDKSLILKRIFK